VIEIRELIKIPKSKNPKKLGSDLIPRPELLLYYHLRHLDDGDL